MTTDLAALSPPRRPHPRTTGFTLEGRAHQAHHRDNRHWDVLRHGWLATH
ncbi:hypothetical protein [Kitasatospora brasiliensis]|nr:hypothetical protein [Kitasatospora sp. K002]